MGPCYVLEECQGKELILSFWGKEGKIRLDVEVCTALTVLSSNVEYSPKSISESNRIE